VELDCGRTNRNGFPEAAYDDEFNEVEVDALLGMDDDCVARADASARSLRHFNSDAAFAFETQTAIAKRANAASCKRLSGS
jgi:hypothetical protein